MNDVLPDEIERLALLGMRLYPASQFSKAGCIKRGPDLATCDLDQIAAWAREFRGCNWRVVMEGSGIWALDVDRPGPDHEADGQEVLAKMVARHKRTPIPPRPTVRSPSGGFTLVFKSVDSPICGRSGWPKKGLDPKAGRLTINVPPSRHLSFGTPYRWQPAPWDLTPPEAPAWLLKAVAPPPPPKVPIPKPVATSDRARKRLFRAISTVLGAARGTRNQTLNRESFAVARYVAAGSLGEQEALEHLYAAAIGVGLDHHEAKATIQSGYRSGLRAEPLERVA